MATTETTKDGRPLSITEIAIRERRSYHSTREDVLRGRYGRVVRIGTKLFVEQRPGADPPEAA